MKKITGVFLCLMASYILAGCGNSTFIDTTYTYNYAIIELQNGEVIEGEVDKWCDYEGEQLQITIDGTIYLTNSYNCTLIYKEDVEAQQGDYSMVVN